MKHNLYEAADFMSGISKEFSRMVIVDGVKVCRECGCSGDQLTTDCPGHRVMPHMRDAIAEGFVDFKDGRYINNVEFFI